MGTFLVPLRKPIFFDKNNLRIISLMLMKRSLRYYKEQLNNMGPNWPGVFSRLCSCI
jgi:hypothetical protein